MSFNLQSIKTSVQLPPRIALYGVPGIGKTTFACDMPSPIVLPIEDGLGQLKVKAFPKPQTFNDCLDAIDSLIGEDHPYQSLILDGMGQLETLIWAHVCKEVDSGKFDRIESFGYGKGFTHALSEWDTLLRGLDALREEKGMSICLVGHSQVVKFEHPEADPYDRYEIAMHKKAAAAITRWADAVLFCNYDITVIPTGDKNSDKKRGVGKGKRSMFTEERPAYIAKNRYGMAEKMELKWSVVGPALGIGYEPTAQEIIAEGAAKKEAAAATK